MACGGCAQRRKRLREQAEKDLLRAEERAAQGKITQAALARIRAKAIRRGVQVLDSVAKTLGIQSEVEDGAGTTEDAEAHGDGVGTDG